MSYYYYYRMLSYVLNIFHCMEKTKNYPDVFIYANDCACRGKALQRVEMSVYYSLQCSPSLAQECRSSMKVKIQLEQKLLFRKEPFVVSGSIFSLVLNGYLIICMSSGKNMKKSFEYFFWSYASFLLLYFLYCFL